MGYCRKRGTPRGRGGHFPDHIVHPDGVSWQASVLNFVSRHAIKGPVARRGLSPGAIRTAVAALERASKAFSRSTVTHQTTIAGVPCDVVRPLNPPARQRVVLHLHGGGFFAHLPHAYTRFARRIAEAFDATVYLPDYRLAPEHRYPAAPDDCMAVYRALLEAGCNPQQLCVMGDSAGGNLTLVTLLRARDQQLPLPACAIAISAGADLTFSGESYRRNADADPFIPMRALHQVVSQYVDADAVAHPHVSPMLGDFSGLPPLKFVVGSTEVLLDSSVVTAQYCRAAGVDVVLQVWHRMPHVFPIFGFLPEGQLAMGHMVDFFRKHTRAR